MKVYTCREVTVQYRGGVKYTGPVNNAATAANFVRKALLDEVREQFVVLMMDYRNRVVAYQVASVGSFNRVGVSPGAVLQPATVLGVTRIIVAHNHPDGTPTPSQEDLLTTKRLVDACRILDKELLDHVIVWEDGELSLRDTKPGLWE